MGAQKIIDLRSSLTLDFNESVEYSAFATEYRPSNTALIPNTAGVWQQELTIFCEWP